MWSRAWISRGLILVCEVWRAPRRADNGPMSKGAFWRSSVRRTLRTILEQVWGEREVKEVAMIPAGMRLLDAKNNGDLSVPRVEVTWKDKLAYEMEPDTLLHLVNRVCIELMRKGYEIRENLSPITPDSMEPRVSRANGRRPGFRRHDDEEES